MHVFPWIDKNFLWYDDSFLWKNILNSDPETFSYVAETSGATLAT